MILVSSIYNEENWSGPISGSLNLHSYPSCLIEYDRLSFNINRVITSINELDDTVIKTYPNPFCNYIKIDAPKKSSIEIFNIHGQSISKIIATEPMSEMDSTNWPPGTYLATIENLDLGISYTQKLIKH